MEILHKKEIEKQVKEAEERVRKEYEGKLEERVKIDKYNNKVMKELSDRTRAEIKREVENENVDLSRRLNEIEQEKNRQEVSSSQRYDELKERYEERCRELEEREKMMEEYKKKLVQLGELCKGWERKYEGVEKEMKEGRKREERLEKKVEERNQRKKMKDEES